MMLAKILETPDRSRPQSDDKLAEYMRQSSSADKDYYRRRATQEDDAAGKASCCEARLAHEELATAYPQLCQSNGVQVDPR